MHMTYVVSFVTLLTFLISILLLIRTSKIIDLLEEMYEDIEEERLDEDNEKIAIEDLNRRLRQLHTAKFGYMGQEKVRK